jgi:hypothetical protein
MIAIHTNDDDKVMIYYTDQDDKSVTLVHSFSGCKGSIQFTLDDKYASYKTLNGLAFCDITTGRKKTDPVKISYKTKQKTTIVIKIFSPAISDQRLLVYEGSYSNDAGYYIASYWESQM